MAGGGKKPAGGGERDVRAVNLSSLRHRGSLLKKAAKPTIDTNIYKHPMTSTLRVEFVRGRTPLDRKCWWMGGPASSNNTAGGERACRREDGPIVHKASGPGCSPRAQHNSRVEPTLCPLRAIAHGECCWPPQWVRSLGAVVCAVSRAAVRSLPLWSGFVQVGHTKTPPLAHQVRHLRANVVHKLNRLAISPPGLRPTASASGTRPKR